MEGHTWIGWSPYQRFLNRLYSVNPTAAVLERNAPQTFRAVQAAVPFTNTPERASSTFVRNIRYMPQSQVAFVKLGNNEYAYGVSPRQLSMWLNYRSLGQFYNNHIKGKNRLGI